MQPPSPDPYAAVRAELAGTRFGDITFVCETASTNDDAVAVLGDPLALGRSFVAEHQTAGRGRKGRSWIAPAGSSLLVTTILPQALDAPALWAVPFWAALALRSALAQFRIPSALHWPNDVLLPGAGKLAGILCVSRVTGSVAYAACGIGVNVRRPVPDDASIEPPPAYCDDVAPIDRAALLAALLRAYDASTEMLSNAAAVAGAWETAAGVPGARYRIRKDASDEAFEARAVALEDGGALIVCRDDGSRESIPLADARALR